MKGEIRMKKARTIRVGVLAGLLAVLCTVMFCLAGCGGGKEITAKVTDSGVVTEVTTSEGKTVEEVLKAGEITLGEKDEVEPAADTKVTEEANAITIKRYAKVKIVNGDETKEVELVGGTAADALKKADITLGKNDSIDVKETDYLKDGQTIKVTRALNISLTENGKTKNVKTTAATVKDFLKEQDLTVGKDDRLNVKETDKLKDGDKIVLDRVTTKTETVEESIPYTSESQYSDSMDQGTSQVTQNGVNGAKTVTYTVTYVNGTEESRQQVSEEVTQNPVNEIVTYGTKVKAPEPAPSQPESSAPAESQPASGGRTVVSKQKVDDCDGSGHGYYIIKYSDGTEEYEDY